MAQRRVYSPAELVAIFRPTQPPPDIAQFTPVASIEVQRPLLLGSSLSESETLAPPPPREFRETPREIENRRLESPPEPQFSPNFMQFQAPPQRQQQRFAQYMGYQPPYPYFPYDAYAQYQQPVVPYPVNYTGYPYVPYGYPGPFVPNVQQPFYPVDSDDAPNQGGFPGMQQPLRFRLDGDLPPKTEQTMRFEGPSFPMNEEPLIVFNTGPIPNDKGPISHDEPAVPKTGDGFPSVLPGTEWNHETNEEQNFGSAFPSVLPNDHDIEEDTFDSGFPSVLPGDSNFEQDSGAFPSVLEHDSDETENDFQEEEESDELNDGAVLNGNEFGSVLSGGDQMFESFTPGVENFESVLGDVLDQPAPTPNLVVSESPVEPIVQSKAKRKRGKGKSEARRRRKEQKANKKEAATPVIVRVETKPLSIFLPSGQDMKLEHSPDKFDHGPKGIVIEKKHLTSVRLEGVPVHHNPTTPTPTSSGGSFPHVERPLRTQSHEPVKPPVITPKSSEAPSIDRHAKGAKPQVQTTKTPPVAPTQTVSRTQAAPPAQATKTAAEPQESPATKSQANDETVTQESTATKTQAQTMTQEKVATQTKKARARHRKVDSRFEYVADPVDEPPPPPPPPKKPKRQTRFEYVAGD